MSANNKSSSGLTVALGVIGALAGFAVVTVLLQMTAGGKPEDPASAERLKKKETVASEQAALLEKYGMDSPAKTDAVFARAGDQIKTRKVAASALAVPGSPTALKQAAAAPAPSASAPPAPAANAPATPSPAAPAPSTAPVAPPK